MRMMHTPPQMTRTQLDRRIDGARQLRAETLRAMAAAGWAALRLAAGIAPRLIRRALPVPPVLRGRP